MNLRRISLAAALALALPVVASAQSRSSAGSGLGAGLLVGMESNNGETGLALRADGVLDSKWIAPKVLLSGVLSVGFMHWGDSRSDPFYTYDSSENVFKVIPAIRFTFDVAPQFGLYTDAGLGFYYASANVTTKDRTFGGVVQDATNSGLGVAMRFAGGAFFKISEGFRLGAEVGLNPYFGEISDTTFTLMGLAQFRL